MQLRHLAPAFALVLIALTLAACGDSAQQPEISTAADGQVVAELTNKSGDSWTVTLPEGATEAYDLYGNDGKDPIRIWSEGPISGKVGELFAIGLLQQAGTGYAWRPTDDSATGSVVELIEQGVNPDDPGREAVGGTETQYYVYRGTAAGTGTIVFGYFPPGEDAPEKTVSFAITITT